MVLDVESGALHEVDELVFEMARVWEKEGRDAVLPALAGRFAQEELEEALGELDQLKESGLFDAPEQPYVPFSGHALIVKSMCLHVTHDCNLRCDYCFAGKGDYHSGKAFLPLDVGKKALEFLMTHSGERRHLEVDFFGGEPLMNFEVVKELVAYGRGLEKEYDKEIKFTMTTNCLLASDEVVDFCREEIGNVVISIDGRKEVHDRVRRTVGGQDSYHVVLPRAQALGLARQRDGQEYYARATFTRNNLDFSRDVLALVEAGFEQVSVEPVVLPDADPLSIREEDLPAVLAEYDRLADIIAARRKQGDWFNFFHFMVDLDNGPCLAKRMSGCGAGSEYVAVTPQGDIYPCHQFVGQPAYRMGSVLNGSFDRQQQQRFADNNLTQKPACRQCWAKYFCSGGCMANAAQFNGVIDQPYRPACIMEKKRVELALDLHLQELHEENQALDA